MGDSSEGRIVDVKVVEWLQSGAGVAVQLEDGTQGFIHVSDLSWTPNFKELMATYVPGHALRASVLGEGPPLLLSVKALDLQHGHGVGDIVAAKVVLSGPV